VTVPFRLGAGDSAPVQQTSTTCGSASLTVARMLANPAFAAWIRDGIPRMAPAGGHAASDTDGDTDGGTQAERFAAYEQVVAGRTNSLAGPGGTLQLPWPRALGTPPWGARRELELLTPDPAARYETRWTRWSGGGHRARAYRVLRDRVRRGRPALLFIGSAWLPRHVVLVLSGTASTVEVYEPASGRVLPVAEKAFVDARLGLAGWNVPWVVISAS
jgi:hypothetical protein